MSIQFDENGLIIQNLSEILDERENDCKKFLGDDFTISGESVVANLQTADADRELQLQELLLYIASQLDPEQAEGIWLDYICSLNNIERRQATKTMVPIIIHGKPNVAKNTGEITIVDTITNEYYTNESPFVIEANGTATTMFSATSWGSVMATPDSVFDIKTLSIGVDKVELDKSKQIKIGRDTETDTELRERRKGAITYTASSILSSIRAVVSVVDGVTYINAYENDTMSPVDTLPAKSFEVVVEGGDDTEIATAILKKKPAGIQSYGTTTKTIVDEDGNKFNIGFTRPTKVPIDYTLTFYSETIQTEEWKDALKQELIKSFQNMYNVGDTVYSYNLYCVLNKHPEIINVTEFKIRKHETAGIFSDSVEIRKRELATLSAANITINQIRE